MSGPPFHTALPCWLELLEEVAGGAGDVDATGDVTLAIFDALDDAGGLGALGTVGALVGIHDLFPVAGFGNLRHDALISLVMCGAGRMM